MEKWNAQPLLGSASVCLINSLERISGSQVTGSKGIKGSRDLLGLMNFIPPGGSALIPIYLLLIFHVDTFNGQANEHCVT